MAIFQVNHGMNSSFKTEIEADSYKLADEFFTFYQGHGTAAEKVGSVAAKHVIQVRRVAEPSA